MELEVFLMPEMNWKHDELLEDLVQAKRIRREKK